MEKKLYGVKVILHSMVRDKDNIVIQNSYEEMILSVKAENFDSAFEKAEKYAKGYCVDYENPYGDTVSTEILDFSDAFESFNEDDGVTEVYSNHYYEDGKECSRDDLKAFLNKEFNRSFKNDDV